MELSVFRGDLQITSKETALDFWRCVKCCHLIPCGVLDSDGITRIYIRVEPGNYISRVTSDEIRNGSAVFVPSLYDPYGDIVFRWRKYINAWLRGK